MADDQTVPPKLVLSARVSESGYEYVKKLAEEQDVTVSHMTRRMLMFAVSQMPRNWRPTKEQLR
jgi:hypothetical protein